MPRTIVAQSVSAHAARTLLLDAQGLLADPRRPASASELHRLIRQLGFVQIDSINVVQRAHHLTLASRIDGYEPAMLTQLLERDRTLFEHWTHDASAIPVEFFAHWKPRFARYTERAMRSTWWKDRLGPNPIRTINHVRERIACEGPLRSRDFEHNGKSGPWWGWKPQKVALEHLWRSGELSIVGRVSFQKIYDLTERVFPELHGQPQPDADQHLDWKCRSALQRLVIASPSEIAAYWNAISVTDARRWCAIAAKSGEIVPVQVEIGGEAKPLAGYALADWQHRLDRVQTPPNRARLLCPFDPIVRDRKRLLRLFGIEYRFEAFVPARKRVYGYYVMPLLEGDRIIGRVDPKLDRGRGSLQIVNWWLEPGIKLTGARARRVEAAVNRLAAHIGAEWWEMPQHPKS